MTGTWIRRPITTVYHHCLRQSSFSTCMLVLVFLCILFESLRKALVKIIVEISLPWKHDKFTPQYHNHDQFIKRWIKTNNSMVCILLPDICTFIRLSFNKHELLIHRTKNPLFVQIIQKSLRYVCITAQKHIANLK